MQRLHIARAAKRRGGFLYELPLLLLVSIIVAAASFPYLAPPWDKVMLGLPAAVFVAVLIYGWLRRR